MDKGKWLTEKRGGGAKQKARNRVSGKRNVRNREKYR
jgi:hypothetical protein